MTTEAESRTKEGVLPRRRLPILEFKETVFKDLKVRVHARYKKGNIQRLYDFCSDWGMDVLEKKEEFAISGWISLAGHLKHELEKIFKLRRVKR